MPLDDRILGKGVYTPREVARLAGTSPQHVLRWTRGSGPNDPLWSAYYHYLDNDVTELSFLDLVEVRVVSAMRAAGISLQAIRFAINFSKDRLGIDRPLSSRSFKTDGREILMNAVEQDDELLSLSKKWPGQKVFKRIVDQSLNDLEYDGDTVARWRPTKFENIVIDPARYFGDPILDEYGVSTHLLYKEFKEFSDLGYLSSIYEIPKKVLRQGINFEENLDASNDKSPI